MPQILLKKLQNLSSLKKKAQPEPDQAGEETHETDGENDSEQSASKDVLEEKTHETDGENDSEQSASKDVLEEKTEEERYDKGLAKSRKGFGAKSMRFLQISDTLMKISLMIWKKR